MMLFCRSELTDKDIYEVELWLCGNINLIDCLNGAEFRERLNVDF